MKKINHENLMAVIPTIDGVHALKNFKDLGYEFIQETCREHATEIFQVKVFFKNIICVTGRDAAELFYNPVVFERKGVIPKRIQKTLLGENGVQTLDGDLHRIRKAMFMSLMTPDKLWNLKELLANYWMMYIRRWEKMDEVVLFKDTQQILCRAACAWAGVPLDEQEVEDRANDFAAMVDAFGAIGPRHWRGKPARKRTEEWIKSIINRVDTKEITPAEGTALHVITSHRENNDLMNDHITAVELINVIRPIVAISYFITFSALAMHNYPACVQKLKKEEPGYIQNFVQEVRRLYPFAPFTGARAKQDIEWHGFTIPKDALVFLDIYGTNHDPKTWANPGEFIPERFQHWDGDPFNFIPQGGGNYDSGHRCAGENLTIEAMKLSIAHLTNFMTYNVPTQDLTFSMNRIPTYPESGFLMTNVKPKDTLTVPSSMEAAHTI
jgi:fatty-acid peroxygenase